MTLGAETLDELYDLYAKDPAFSHLKAGATRLVKGEGPTDSIIAFIGEAPGKNEDATGRPFVGPSGEVFDELLQRIRVERRNVFITNVLKYRPSDNRDPTWGEIDLSKQYVLRELELLDTDIVCTMGRHPLSMFFPQLKLTNVHGKVLDFNGKTFVPLYHPAVSLYSPSMRTVIDKDIDAVGHILDEMEKH